MKISESWKNWLIAGGLLIFAGLASAVWLYFSSQESTGGAEEDLAAEQLPVVIQIEDYLLGSDLLKLGLIQDLDGTEISQGLVVLGALVIVSFTVVGFGVVLALITWFGSRQITTVETSDGYLEATRNLEARRKEEVKALMEEQPPNEPLPQEKRAGWSWFATSLMILVLVWSLGLILGATLLHDVSFTLLGLEIMASTSVNLILILLTAIVLYVVARRRGPVELQSGVTDNQPVNWGTIWVVVTGLLILGIGTGLAIAMRSIGS